MTSPLPAVVGRRGLASTVLCYKLGGALAAKGADVDAVYDVASFVADNTATIGVGLDHCHIPGTSTQEVHLGPDEMELCVLEALLRRTIAP